MTWTCSNSMRRERALSRFGSKKRNSSRPASSPAGHFTCQTFVHGSVRTRGPAYTLRRSERASELLLSKLSPDLSLALYFCAPCARNSWPRVRAQARRTLRAAGPPRPRLLAAG